MSQLRAIFYVDLNAMSLKDSFPLSALRPLSVSNECLWGGMTA